jgi:RsiW-degrading membrane proteinase PrsW (M82 family)
LIKKPNQGGFGMADVNSTVKSAASGIVGVIKALIVLFVFVNIVYSTGFDPIGGIVDLVNTFLDGGFAGLLALLVFLSFLA